MSEQTTPNPSVPSQIVQELKFPKFVNNLGIIPTSYKDSMSYYECLAWLCKYIEETVIPTVNQNGEAVEELQNLYVELKNYVDNYFKDLNIQEQINNKLDEMANDGTLYSIMVQYATFELLVPQLSTSEELGSFNVLKFPNGFNILFDCGYSGQEDKIEDFLEANEITKFNVVIVSHFHVDHSGCFEFIAENYCDENTLFYRQMNCDYSRLGDYTDPYPPYLQEQTYTETLTTLGYISNSSIPSNNETINWNQGLVQARFLNTDSDYASSYYSAPSDTDANNYQNSTLNNFSLICEITAFNKKILLTGDVELQAQINNEKDIEACDVLQLPHHNWNHNGYYKFFEKVTPKIAYFNRNTALNDPFVYWSRYLRQKKGSVPTYYTYNANIKMNVSTANINVVTGTLDTSYIIPNDGQQLISIVPFYTDYTHNFWSYADWTIKDLITMLLYASPNVYSVPIFQNSRYITLLSELNSITGISVSYTLKTLTRGFTIERMSNWDGEVYKFLEGFNYSNTDSYVNNLLIIKTPFSNKSTNVLDVAEGYTQALTNSLRNPQTLKAQIQFVDGASTLTYDIVLKYINANRWAGDLISMSVGADTYHYLRINHVEITITNNTVNVVKCKLHRINIENGTVVDITGKLVKLDSTDFI